MDVGQGRRPPWSHCARAA